MSNFQCPYCGMINIDCGKEGFKTLKEINYEHAFDEIEEYAKGHDDLFLISVILDIIREAGGGNREI